MLRFTEVTCFGYTLEYSGHFFEVVRIKNLEDTNGLCCSITRNYPRERLDSSRGGRDTPYYLYKQGTVTDLNDVRKVFADSDVTGVVIALGGKTADVGKTMLTDGECVRRPE